jgi:acyl-CoA reductase-like NAD-dependent aldehyde dehydrogenase
MAASIQELIERAQTAQKEIEHWSQEKVDQMVAAVGWELYKEENAIKCAELAVKETKMGVYEDKLLKHRKKTLGTLRDLQGIKTVGVVEVDEAKGLIKIAKPVGVVAAVTPVTNPTSTPAGNGLSILKTRNACIIAAHLFARKTTALAVEHMRAGLAKVGAPIDLVQILPKPTKDAIQELMAAADLVVATGSGALVKAAYSSGTPAYGVGAGNAAIIVDETADIADAAKKIFISKTFDNATSCSTENSLVIQESVRNDLLSALKSHGGYLCSAEEKAQLKETLWPDGEHLNAKIVARPILKIAEMAGLNVPKGTTFIMVEGNETVEDDLYAAEKLSAVVRLWSYNDFSEAIEYVERITRKCGYGHSCGIHSANDEHIMELAMKCHVSRMMVCQPQCYANSGNYDNGMPFTMTLGCGTWGGNITSDNISWKNFLNTTWVSKPITPVIPNEVEIFGKFLNT